jgi:hypothetical protein
MSENPVTRPAAGSPAQGKLRHLRFGWQLFRVLANNIRTRGSWAL